MTKKISEDCLALWRQLVEAEKAFYSARMELFSKCRDSLVELIQNRLNIDRVTAINLVPLLTVDERKLLFDDILSLASFGHGLIGSVRDVILSMPSDWLLANIEKSAEPLLGLNDLEVYGRLLEFFVEIDRDLALRLARRAAAHADGDIREAGEHFIDILESE